MSVLLQRIRDLERRLDLERRRRNELGQWRDKWRAQAHARAATVRRLRSDLRRARESRNMWRQRYFDLRWQMNGTKKKAA